MNTRIIAVCDSDEHYALSFSRIIEEALKDMFVVCTFSSVDALEGYLIEKNVDVLVISETAYKACSLNGYLGTLIILRENSSFVPENGILIDRFQSREKLLLSVLKSLPDELEAYSGKREESRHWKIIGVYSPVRRCLQTSFALALGQMLGSNHKVLYMNFESFSGFSGWMKQEFEADILDLLYFFNCDPDKLKARIPMVVHRIGQLDILPPAKSSYDTYDRSGEKWIDFFHAIEDATEYEYLILDLTDAMPGLMSVMQYCNRIYTLIKDEALAKYKIAQYEQWMVEHSYADVISKSMKFCFPEFTDIPERPEMLTQSELANYVRAIIDEDKIED